MTQYYMVNNIPYGNEVLYAGTLLDTIQGDDVSAIQAAGGVVVAASFTGAADQAAIANSMRLRGAPPDQIMSVMLGLVAAGGSDDAAASADAAAASAAAALVSEGNASDSADAAATSETNAGTSETNAAASAASAAADATGVVQATQQELVTLVAGTTTVSDLDITAGSVIIPIRETSAGTPGDLSIANQTPGTPGSFDVNSGNAADVSKVRVVVLG